MSGARGAPELEATDSPIGDVAGWTAKEDIGPIRALVVVNTPTVSDTVSVLLSTQGFAVLTIRGAETGLRAAREFAPDVVVLASVLEGTDGLTVCRKLRRFSDVYVLLLVEPGVAVEAPLGLAAGADDVLAVPFSAIELIARVRAMLRRPRPRSRPPTADLRRFGALTIDIAAREVKVNGNVVRLTRREFDLLEVLSGSPRITFTRAMVIDRVWGAGWFEHDHVLNVHVCNLRRKLGDDARAPRFVLTVRGVGLRMGRGS